MTVASPQGPARRNGPPWTAAFRTLHGVRYDRLAFITASIAEFGDLVAFRIGPRQLFLINDPDCVRQILADRPDDYEKGIGLTDAGPLLGEGLLTSEADRWASDRRQLHSFFTSRSAAAFAEAAVDHSLQLIARCADGAVVDVAAAMTGLTLGVLGSALFQYDLRDDATAIARDLATMSEWAMRHMAAIAPLPLHVPTPRNLRAGAALRRLDRLARRLVQGSRDLDAQSFLAHVARGAGTREGRRHARDTLLTILLAGHETTAAVLTWTWWLLGSHPHVVRRLEDEMQRVLGGRPATRDDVTRLTYTRQVLDEAMRLYPPVWMITRRARRTHTLGGRVISRGADLLLSVYTLHRHARHWPDPDAFVPERFSGSPGGRHPYAYLPFGAGPRACVGKGLAVTEAALVLATLCSRLRFEPVDAAPPRPQPNLTLRPDGPVRMRVVHSAGREVSKTGEAARAAHS